MTASVEAMPPEEFNRWLARRGRGAGGGDVPARRGDVPRRLLEVPRAWPARAASARALAGNQLLDDAEAVEQVIRNGRGEMPPIGKSWDERQMKALTDYLEEELLGG